MKGVFVTGTDTGIGKTWFTLACIRSLQAAGIKTAAMKPVASGAELVSGKLVNEDALLIQKTLDRSFEYGQINPYCFAPPISPHIAAAEAGVNIDLQVLGDIFESLCSQTDFILVEGAGGWLAPLSPELTIADMAKSFGLPVVMVVGMKLGCINHACLTYEAIKASGLELAAWVANCIDPLADRIEQQLESISNCVGKPAEFIIGINDTNISAEQLISLS